MITYLIRLVVPLLLIAPWPVIAGSGTGEALPAVLFSSESHRFSPVLEGKSVSHDFVFENRGNAELRITKVKTD